ncbi:RDD family protein [Nocardia sp. NBC_00416]|uniref:RDD family protein n=1 Tax=Nocardia sp. NBC_00416 TaxID=2975991 RepID=UPI002E1AD2D2
MTSGGYDPSNHPQGGQPYGQPAQYPQPGQYVPQPEHYAPQPDPYAQQAAPYGHQAPPQAPEPAPKYQQTVFPQPQYGGQQYGQFQPAFGVPGNLWPRFAARLIDNLIIALPLAVLLNFVLMPNLDGFVGPSISYAIIFAVTLVYSVSMEWKTGATLGKKILGLKVVAPDGAPTVAPLVSLKRNVYLAVLIVPCVGWVGGCALMLYMAATLDKNPNKQGWHDKLAGGTQVLVA